MFIINLHSISTNYFPTSYLQGGCSYVLGESLTTGPINGILVFNFPVACLAAARLEVTRHHAGT